MNESSESIPSMNPLDSRAGQGPPSMADVDREVEDALASMAPDDLAELTGGGSATDEAAPGAELIGTITGVTDNDVFLQFGVKSQGLMPRSQFGKKEALDIGRRVDVVVDRFDAAAALYIVSRKGAAQRATWTTLTVGMLVEGRVTGLIKGGLEVDLKGIRAFMPGSLTDAHPMKDISILLNQNIKAEVVELDRRSKSVIVSRRKVMEREIAEAREKLKGELEVGQVRSGVVRSIVDFGAFVDLGGVDGLIHIGELSWGTVNKVSDVLSPGQRVDVMVLKIDQKKDRISLGLKQIQPDPWTMAPNRYPVGTAVKVKVVRIADFGAFAELEPGIEGLIPVSEMGWSRIKHTTDVVTVGGMVDCVVIRLELDKKRLALSMRQAQADPWAGVFDGFAVNSVVKGKVTRLADFGAFVELSPGVEGLIHISELSDKRVKTCGDVVQPGQEVEARILGLDREQRRISLSIKSLHAAVAAEHAALAASTPATPERKRKKPLRGGLSSHFEW